MYGSPRVATPPQISSNLKFLLKFSLISSKMQISKETFLKSQIQKIENSILAISLLNNTNIAVKHNCVLGVFHCII